MIGVFIVCINREYDQFLQPLITSLDKYFLPEKGKEVYYAITTDESNIITTIETNRPVLFKLTPNKQWPMPTLLRFKYFNYFINSIDSFTHETSHYYYIDVDAYLVSQVNLEDIDAQLTFVQHCGFVGRPGTFENRPERFFYINDAEKNKIYLGGGFFGGQKAYFWKMSLFLERMIDEAIRAEKIPIHNDESAINWYYHNFQNIQPGMRILTPAFHYPEPPNDFYKILWQDAGLAIEPVIMLVDKFKNGNKTFNKLRS